MDELCHQLPLEAQEAIFAQPLDQILAQSPDLLQKWIIPMNKYMKQQRCAVKKCAKLKTPDIHSFFQPHNPVTNDLQPP